jgi:hypothetical protein
VVTLLIVELADANAPVGPHRAYAVALAIVSTSQPVAGSFAIVRLSASAKASAEAPPSQVTTAMACTSPAAWSPPAAGQDVGTWQLLGTGGSAQRSASVHVLLYYTVTTVRPQLCKQYLSTYMLDQIQVRCGAASSKCTVACHLTLTDPEHANLCRARARYSMR